MHQAGCRYHSEMGSPVSDRKFTLNRRQFLGISGLSVAGLGLYAGEVSRHELEIVHRTITLDRLPDSFKGFRIIQVSDFHYRPYTEAFFIRHVVREVNKLPCDMVVLTGDFTTGVPLQKKQGVQWAHECAEMLSYLTCQQRYAVLGNHDCIVGAAAVKDALQMHGIPVLENNAIALERNGERIWLAGLADALHSVHPVTDLNTTIPDAVRIDKELVILLAHEPDVAQEAAKRNVDLMLSGHTHGGQVRFPLVPPMFLPVMGKKYIEGHYRIGPTQLYVNRGIGAVNLPFRFNCPPEITVITLA